MSPLEQAIARWRDLLGAEHVLTDEATLTRMQTATFATTQRVPAVIRPASRDDVQACVRIANMYKTPLYPVSTGKNWGYGSRVPVQSGCVVMELSRLDRIVDYDESLAYVTVEPGVTVRQLEEFLRAQESTLCISMTGSTSSASLIGNALERGLGSGPYADRFAAVCGLEVVLPTGDCIHTGFARFPEARAAAVHRWGVGPYVDGLFTQSNLGIVTGMTLWLQPAPAYSQACYFAIGSADRLEALIDTLRNMKFAGLPTDPVHLDNDYKVLSGIAQYPWAGEREPASLSPEMMASLRPALGIGAWNGAFGLHAAGAEQGLMSREWVRQQLEGRVDQLLFTDSTQTRVYASLAGAGLDLAELFEVRPDTDAVGAEGRVRSTYWRKKTPPPPDPDPDRDGCGVMWCAPVVPFAGRHVAAAVRLIEPVVTEHQFEPFISLLCLTERSAIVNAALFYDRTVAGEDERAAACHAALLQRLGAAGYFPYRLGIQSMDALPAPTDHYGAFLRTLKTALDPNDILAPGRYDFRTDWPVEMGDA
jgi:4-cresol dehydrogenase (hydroxylating) flavoprotein subunit